MACLASLQTTELLSHMQSSSAEPQLARLYKTYVEQYENLSGDAAD